MPGAKAGYCTCPLNTLPPKGWAKLLSHTSSLTPEHTSTLTPYKVQAPPSLQSRQARETVVCSLSPCCSRGPNNALLREKKKKKDSPHKPISAIKLYTRH